MRDLHGPGFGYDLAGWLQLVQPVGGGEHGPTSVVWPRCADISVPHDEAPRRLKAALAAGGRVVFDAQAPAWWVLADPEGNEACITTWQGRD